MTYTITAMKPQAPIVQHSVTDPKLCDKWLALYKRNRYRTHVKVTL